MINTELQKQKAINFSQLHHSDQPLVLPNIWEPLGALILEDTGYPAVATSSSALALAHGFQDGENISFEEHLDQLSKIAHAVSIPVSADIEAGYANGDDHLLAKHMEDLINAGIVGINFEDSDRKTKSLVPIDIQKKRIEIIRDVADKCGVPLFINARTDVYLPWLGLEKEECLQEALKRGEAYKNAGADCIFPIFLKDPAHVRTLTQELQTPINVLFMAGIMDFEEMKSSGVARFSFGSSFMGYAMGSMRNLATMLRTFSGKEQLSHPGIEHGYLEGLVKKSADLKA